MGLERGVKLSQRDKFWELFASNQPRLAEDLRLGAQISPIYEVVTPSDQRFFVIAFRRSVPSNGVLARQDFINLVAFEPDKLKRVGYSRNVVSFFPRKPALIEETSSVATEETGNYYGFGLELVRQHQFQAVANREGTTVVERALDFFNDGNEIWKHFYGDGGVFGYNKSRRTYSPEQPIDSELPAGYTITLRKEDGKTSWDIQRDDEVVASAVTAGLTNLNTVLEKISEI